MSAEGKQDFVVITDTKTCLLCSQKSKPSTSVYAASNYLTRYGKQAANIHATAANQTIYYKLNSETKPCICHLQ